MFSIDIAIEKKEKKKERNKHLGYNHLPLNRTFHQTSFIFQ